MDYTAVNTTANIITALGTLLTGIFAALGIVKYIGSVAVKNETLYGEEAGERFRQIEDKLNSKSAQPLKSLPYDGSDTLITPRLEIRKISNYSKTIGKEWKGRKALIKFFDRKTAGDKTITIDRWLL